MNCFKFLENRSISVHSEIFCSDVNDCAEEICENGGTCIDGIDEYSCTCVIGYAGSKCETSNHFKVNSVSVIENIKD